MSLIIEGRVKTVDSERQATAETHLSGKSNGGGSEIGYNVIYSSCVTEGNELVRSINKIRKKQNQPPLDTATKHSWIEVDESVVTACDDMQRLAKNDAIFSGISGGLKNAFRRLCRHAGAGETFVSLIPGDQLGLASILCGGLKAIFAALKKVDSFRQDICIALEELPPLIYDVKVPLDENCNDEELHSRAASFYVAIFRVLKRILLWFARKSVYTGFQLLVNPSYLPSVFHDELANVKLKANDFDRRIRNITQKRLSCIHQDVREIHRQVHNSGREPRYSQDDFEDRCRPMIRDEVKQALLETQQAKPKRLSQFNLDTTLTTFQYDQDMVSRDYSSLTRLIGTNISADVDQCRMAALESNYRVQAWLTLDKPSLLLVNGQTQERPDNEISVFSARLASSLVSYSQSSKGTRRGDIIIFPLIFFCGEHRDHRRDRYATPAGLILHLFLQLVDQLRGMSSRVILRHFDPPLDSGDITSICKAMEELVMALPRNVFLCIIVDGLVFWDQHASRRQEMRQVVSQLVKLYRMRLKATAKILFTNPTRPVFVEDLFEDGEIVHISHSFMYDFSSAMMDWKQPLRIFGDD